MSPFVAALLAVAASMVGLWCVSLRMRDASIADIYWGCGFVLVAWVYFLLAEVATPRKWLVAGLVTAWGLRLSAHLLLRNRGKGEDYRYREMRRQHGRAFWWISLFKVFLLQGAILWFVALPLGVVMRAPAGAGVVWGDTVGIALFSVGMFFEVVGDLQLARFKADPGNRGKLMTDGLWRYTRHPNYFGDALVWWGLAAIALATPGPVWVVLSPLLMTFLLVRVSGVALLERRMSEAKPGFSDYAERTNAFFPWFPREPRA